MANERTGAQAVGEALGVAPGEGLRAVADERAAEQVDLFELEREDFARQFPQVAQAREAAEARGPGRPKGARNRVTRDTLRLLQADPGFVDPLVFMARVLSMQPAEIKRAYGLKGAEALSAQLRAAADLAPFIHSKQAQGIKLEGCQGAAAIIQIGGWDAAQPEIQGGRVIDGAALAGVPVGEPDISTAYEDEADQVTHAPSHTADDTIIISIS